MPMACAVCNSVKSISLGKATAAPMEPVVEVLCQPRSYWEGQTARPSLHEVSMPATRAAMRSEPETVTAELVSA